MTAVTVTVIIEPLAVFMHIHFYMIWQYYDILDVSAHVTLLI